LTQQCIETEEEKKKRRRRRRSRVSYLNEGRRVERVLENVLPKVQAAHLLRMTQLQQTCIICDNLHASSYQDRKDVARVALNIYPVQKIFSSRLVQQEES
jgi:hypothetical protein